MKPSNHTLIESGGSGAQFLVLSLYILDNPLGAALLTTRGGYFRPFHHSQQHQTMQSTPGELLVFLPANDIIQIKLMIVNDLHRGRPNNLPGRVIIDRLTGHKQRQLFHRRDIQLVDAIYHRQEEPPSWTNPSDGTPLQADPQIGLSYRSGLHHQGHMIKAFLQPLIGRQPFGQDEKFSQHRVCLRIILWLHTDKQKPCDVCRILVKAPDCLFDQFLTVIDRKPLVLQIVRQLLKHRISKHRGSRAKVMRLSHKQQVLFSIARFQRQQRKQSFPVRQKDIRAVAIVVDDRREVLYGAVIRHTQSLNGPQRDASRVREDRLRREGRQHGPQGRVAVLRGMFRDVREQLGNQSLLGRLGQPCHDRYRHIQIALIHPLVGQ